MDEIMVKQKHTEPVIIHGTGISAMEFDNLIFLLIQNVPPQSPPCPIVIWLYPGTGQFCDKSHFQGSGTHFSKFVLSG
ncbi:hypothetical protein [Desulfonema magnum]|uniref:hypothetical protein n=1 Tax=Desulfonema magnum TaxID=45655 RepID=UPI001A9BB68E|nr:hypothetical protein [Desulfonema magnum]